MPKINILDKSIYNRISAGEVVERPFSVCKELIENSIDAKASEITVKVIDGGKTLIEVSDDGVGMDKEDLSRAILPHATSKISRTSDLDKIVTLGFRGEALASIASVSKMKISSRYKECKQGYSISVIDGEVEEVVESPQVNGTTITVENLFYNTPARQKFLKSVRQEENEVLDYVGRLALANPNIAFKLYFDDGLMLQTFGDGKEETLISVYGDDYFTNSLPISNYKNGISIEGFISKHNFTKPNRTYQTTILNGRYVVNNTIQSAIQNAYQPYLMKRRYPCYVLYINLPQEFVDVNVTPNKSDVRFLDNSVVYGTIYSTISKVLDGTDEALSIIVDGDKKIVPSHEEVEKFNKRREEVGYTPPNPADKIKIVNSLGEVTKFIKYPKDDFTFFDSVGVSESGASSETSQSKRSPSEDIFEENKKYILEQEKKKKEAEQIQQLSYKVDEKFVYVGQALNTYLIFEKNQDLYLVDQHAAHERLLFDKLSKEMRNGKIATQPLLVPYTLKVNGLEYNYLVNHLDYLQDLGFDIEKDGDSSFSIFAIPFELIEMKLDDYFSDVLSDNVLKREVIPQIITDKLMQKACKSAIKGGKKLSQSEVDYLMDLLNDNLDLKCPHGRPIAVKITKYELEKWFKRLV